MNRKQDIVDVVEAVLIDEDVPNHVKDRILDAIYDILCDEIGDED